MSEDKWKLAKNDYKEHLKGLIDEINYTKFN